MIFSYLLNMQSHPSWVCGLKLPCFVQEVNPGESHPSWVCGLKPDSPAKADQLNRHTLRGCVD